jgi:bisphosphoglycerate-dependent phosphoglycerate mutase
MFGDWKCVDCLDTGALGHKYTAGSFCTCEAGKELQRRCVELDQTHCSAVVRAEMTVEAVKDEEDIPF